MASRFEVFPDKNGKFRWRCRAGNGKITANGGEPFASKSNAKRAIYNLIGSFGDGPLIIIELESGES